MLDGLLSGSYLGIILFLILTGCGLPLPEEVAIVAAGVLSAKGVLNPWLALASCLIGALAGDIVMYYIGYHFGRRVLTLNPMWTGFLTPEREKQVEQMFKRHGIKVILLARFLVGLRSPIYITAGILRVPFRRYVIVDFFCATLVIGLFFGVSYLYGREIADLIQRAERGLTIAVIAVGLTALLAFGIYRRRHARRLKQAADTAVVESSRPAESAEVQAEKVGSRE